MSDPNLAPRRKSVSGCTMGLLGLVALLLIGVASVWSWVVLSKRQFTKELQAIQSRGEPITEEDMTAFFALPDGTPNATDLWQKAGRCVDAIESDPLAEKAPIDADSYDLPWVEEGWQQIDEVQTFVDQYRKHIGWMHEAAAMGGAVQFDAQFVDADFFRVEEIWHLRKAARLLRLDSRVQAHRGNTEEVHCCLMTLARAEKAGEYAPFIMHQTIRSSLIQFAAHATSQALYDVRFTDEELAELQSVFESIELTAGLRRALMGERYYAIHIYQSIEGLQDAKQLGESKLFWPQNTQIYFDYMDQCIQLSKPPFTEQPLAEQLTRIETMEAGINDLHGPQHTFTRLLIPSVSSIFHLRARAEASCNVAATGIAIERYRLANGKLPDSLEDLVPRYLSKLHPDPFNSRPLRYVVVDPRRFYLYSVGRNGIDDGGLQRNADQDVYLDDWTFAVGVRDVDYYPEHEWLEKHGLNQKQREPTIDEESKNRLEPDNPADSDTSEVRNNKPTEEEPTEEEPTKEEAVTS